MKNNEEKFPKILALFYSLMFIAQVAGLYFSLYWRYRWLDSVMHFLGGALIGYTVCRWRYFSKKIFAQNHSKFFSVLLAVSIVALVGVFWEFYEFIIDRFITKDNYINLLQPGLIDTMKDLFLDLLGGFFVTLKFVQKKQKNENEN